MPTPASPESVPVVEPIVEASPLAWRCTSEVAGAASWHRNIGLIAVSAHEGPDGWWLETSHGTPPRGCVIGLDAAQKKIVGDAALDAAQKAGDRHMRSQLERTLAALTEAEGEPRTSGRHPRPCGVILLYASDSIAARRREVMAALMEVS